MALKPLKQARTKWSMRNVVTFDIESYDWTNPVAIGVYQGNGDRYFQFKGENCAKEFAEEIMKAKWRRHRFVAHYGGNYDFIPIIQEISKIVKRKSANAGPKFRWKQDILTKGSNDTPFLIIVRKEKKIYDEENDRVKWNATSDVFYLQDSYALMPRSLEKLSKSLYHEAPKMDFDLDKIDKLENMDDEDIEEMEKYLKRDCTTLYHTLSAFSDLIFEISGGKCGPQTTMGSTTMAVYRTAFMPSMVINNCYAPNVKQNPEDCFRKSYFGGRTEVYKMHGKDLYHYDVNSLYPHSYTNFPVPSGDVSHTGEYFPYDDDSVGGVLKIKGYVEEDSAYGIPVLPTRINEDTGDEKVVFGYGEIEGWYMANEVRYAEKVGSLMNVEILDSYSASYQKPFKQFGNHLYNVKKGIDKHNQAGKYLIVKLLLNSFYGKFGMDRVQSSIVQGPVSPEFQGEKRILTDELANMGIMLDEEISDASYILPRIASAITARARVEMHKWFMKVFEKGGNIWYCDTDSIVTDVKLGESEELGGMDLEGEIEECVFLAPKVYAEKLKNGETIMKAKGMRDLDVDFETFVKAYENRNPSLISSEWDGPKGFKAGMKENVENWFIKDDFSRSLKQFDTKRIQDNNESYPRNITGLE